MIAILADTDDRLACLAHEELVARGARTEFIDASTLFRAAGLSWSMMPSAGFLDLGSQILQFNDVRSVMARQRPFLFNALDGGGDEAYVTFEEQATLLGWLAAMPCLVVNRPRPLGAERLILGRGQLPARCGFRLSPTLLTSEPQAAAAFYLDECRGQAVVDCSASQVSDRELDARPLTVIRGSDEVEQIVAMARRAPLVLQALPDGDWLSVWVVGNRAIAGFRDTDGTLQPDELRSDLGEASIRLARALGLDFAAVELVLSGEEAVCLDVSAFPQPQRCASDLEADLISALCVLLAGQAST